MLPAKYMRSSDRKPRAANRGNLLKIEGFDGGAIGRAARTSSAVAAPLRDLMNGL